MPTDRAILKDNIFDLQGWGAGAGGVRAVVQVGDFILRGNMEKLAAEYDLLPNEMVTLESKAELKRVLDRVEVVFANAAKKGQGLIGTKNGVFDWEHYICQMHDRTEMQELLGVDENPPENIGMIENAMLLVKGAAFKKLVASRKSATPDDLHEPYTSYQLFVKDLKNLRGLLRQMAKPFDGGGDGDVPAR